MVIKAAVDGELCEAHRESTVHLTEGLSHHTKCQNLITFTGLSRTDVPKGTFLLGYIMKLQMKWDHYLDNSSLHPEKNSYYY